VARILCLNVEMITADRLDGGRDRCANLFRDLPLLLKKPGQNRAMCRIKEKESESY
jgi:hypothetical protein